MAVGGRGMQGAPKNSHVSHLVSPHPWAFARHHLGPRHCAASGQESSPLHTTKKWGDQKMFAGNPKPNHPKTGLVDPNPTPPNRKFPKKSAQPIFGEKNVFLFASSDGVFGSSWDLTSAGRKQHNLRFRSKKHPL